MGGDELLLQLSSTMGRIFARLTFVPTLAFNVVMEKVSSRRWYDTIDRTVILGALPFRSMTELLVKNENVRGVLSLNETYELKWLSNQEKEWRSVGVKFLQLSTIDIFQVPSQEKLRKGVKFIDSFDKEGKDGLVYVHCKAGRTRSATVVACYLMQKYNWTPEMALDCIRQKRPHILLGPMQLKAIKEYYQKVKD